VEWKTMRLQKSFVMVTISLLVLAGAASAAVYTDGFEGYNIGALDKNASGGANAAPNGSGNPWFGPAPPNAQVVGVDSGVSPHSGSKMIRGAFVTGADIDQNWINLAYRFNSNHTPFTGNVTFDWWFYDPVGQGTGSTNFRDYAAIGYYNTAPNNTDYPGTGSLNSSTQIQRLGLGGFNGNAASQTVYCASIVGETAGDAGNARWFLTAVARSVGWHHGTVVVGPALGNGTNQVTFYVDGVTALSRNSITAYGYNVIEFNTKFGSQTGYFDDVSFTPEPASIGLLALGSLLVRRRRAC
jgi:hypothetical protein